MNKKRGYRRYPQWVMLYECKGRQTSATTWSGDHYKAMSTLYSQKGLVEDVGNPDGMKVISARGITAPGYLKRVSYAAWDTGSTLDF